MKRKSDIARFLAPALYVLNKTGLKLDKHRLFKILYFADKEHIATYGRTFMEDFYIAMANGPVPSRLYDFVKVLEGKTSIPVSEEFKNELSSYLKPEPPYHILALQDPDFDFLSKSALKFLDDSIEQYKNKSFTELTELSHDQAWKAASENTEMSLIEIAKDAGVSSEMLKYIEDTM
jgi:uncharacterized phage-associated protein